MTKDYLQLLREKRNKAESEKLERQRQYERKQYLSTPKQELKDGSVIIWVSFCPVWLGYFHGLDVSAS